MNIKLEDKDKVNKTMPKEIYFEQITSFTCFVASVAHLVQVEITMQPKKHLPNYDLLEEWIKSLSSKVTIREELTEGIADKLYADLEPYYVEVKTNSVYDEGSRLSCTYIRGKEIE